ELEADDSPGAALRARDRVPGGVVDCGGHDCTLLLSVSAADRSLRPSWVLRTMSCCRDTGVRSRSASAMRSYSTALSRPGPGDEAGDRIGVTDDVDGAIPDLLGGFVDDDLSAIDDDDVLDEIGDLIDEVAREHDRAGMVRVVGDETVVEGLPGHRVEAEVGFVEERDLGPRGQADDDADGRLLTAGEFLDRRLQRQAELVDQLFGESLVPMREEQPCIGQRMFGIGILRILLTLAYEAHAAEYAGVLVGVLPEYLDFTAGGEVLGGQ